MSGMPEGQGAPQPATNQRFRGGLVKMLPLGDFPEVLTAPLAQGNLTTGKIPHFYGIGPMPNIATLHPQIVHFVIALGILGVLLRVISLLGKGAWLHPAAATLLILAAGAGVLAQKSGLDAHGPVERVPGVRESVQQHEDWGKRARNVLLAVGVLEIFGLVLATRGAGKSAGQLAERNAASSACRRRLRWCTGHG